MKLLNVIFWMAIALVSPVMAQAEMELFKITAYCSCKKCCGKSDGITASGKQAKNGYVACNWMQFGTKLTIDGKPYIVMDRGAKSQFGDNEHHIKHIDIWMPSHKEALNHGVKWQKVEVVK